MAGRAARANVVNHLGTLFRFGVVGDLSDSQLLHRFLTGRDGADQDAFSALVERHGPMVFGVCREVLGNPHDAQDAFQATFLVMARKAGSVKNGDSLASWLHGVALRVAARARSDAARRRAHERRFATFQVQERENDADPPEPCPELHEELARLPRRYREPVVLCHLEGLTSEQAAVRIGCPAGTVWSRLSRARERLRRSLARRGVALPAAVLAAGLTSPARAAPPAILLDATVRTALGFARRRATEAAVSSGSAITLATGVLHAMTISKMKTICAAAVVCALALGGAQTLTLGQSRGPRESQVSPAAQPNGNDTYSSLNRSVDKLEGELDETTRRNADMRKDLQDIRARLETLSANTRPGDATRAATQFADALKERTAQTVSRLAGALKRFHPQRSRAQGERNQVYMLDVVAGETNLISDEPVQGLVWSGSPNWSHDGSRIAFDATPGTNWSQSHLMVVEVRDGRPVFRDLGPGNCPNFSPDDKQIAFLLNPGAQRGAEPGVWMMDADGSNRHRAGDFGAPFWSPYGREILINTFADFPEITVINLGRRTGAKLRVPGYRIFSWPSWAGAGTLVSVLSTGKTGDAIALLDVSDPAEAKIIEVLWQRGEELDVTPRWPVYWPEMRRAFFIGVEPDKRSLYSLESAQPGRARLVLAASLDQQLGAISFSPDGRYLLFHANRP
jgi:RNA polymerase sigma factor (sigma-70 family)